MKKTIRDAAPVLLAACEQTKRLLRRIVTPRSRAKYLQEAYDTLNEAIREAYKVKPK